MRRSSRRARVFRRQPRRTTAPAKASRARRRPRSRDGDLSSRRIIDARWAGPGVRRGRGGDDARETGRGGGGRTSRGRRRIHEADAARGTTARRLAANSPGAACGCVRRAERGARGNVSATPLRGCGELTHRRSAPQNTRTGRNRGPAASRMRPFHARGPPGPLRASLLAGRRSVVSARKSGSPGAVLDCYPRSTPAHRCGGPRRAVRPQASKTRRPQELIDALVQTNGRSRARGWRHRDVGRARVRRRGRMRRSA